MKAIWNGTVLAESDETKVIEGVHYFPESSLRAEYFESSDHTSICSWKGTASYFDVVVDGHRNENAAWVYRAPKDAAAEIKDYAAFWKGVEVVA